MADDRHGAKPPAVRIPTRLIDMRLVPKAQRARTREFSKSLSNHPIFVAPSGVAFSGGQLHCFKDSRVTTKLVVIEKVKLTIVNLKLVEPLFGERKMRGESVWPTAKLKPNGTS